MFYYCGAASEQRAARCIVAARVLLERGLPRDVESLHPRVVFLGRLRPDWAARPALTGRAAHAVESKAVVRIEVLFVKGQL
jgi:hypothetical protein